MVNVEEYIDLSKKVAANAAKKFSPSYTFDELLSFAQLGLVKAAKKFDESKGFKFSTYASEVMYHSILMSIRDDRWFTGTREATTWLKPVMYENKTNEDGTTLLELIIEESYDFENVEFKNLILSILEQRELQVIQLIFFEDKTQKEISEMMKCGQANIARIKKSALSKLKEALVM